MNNEELKKKIVEIINDGIIHGEDNFGMPTSKTIENIADALIEAGVVDKSDYASMKETAVKYKADFVYEDKEGKTIVEDVKGYKGGGAYAVFVIKKKLMCQVFGIDVREI